jgi:hypothetical protein
MTGSLMKPQYLGLFLFCLKSYSITPNPFMGFTYERGIYPREDTSTNKT